MSMTHYMWLDIINRYWNFWIFEGWMQNLDKSCWKYHHDTYIHHTMSWQMWLINGQHLGLIVIFFDGYNVTHVKVVMRNLVEAVEEEAAPELGKVSFRFLFQKDCDNQNSGVKIGFFCEKVEAVLWRKVFSGSRGTGSFPGNILSLLIFWQHIIYCESLLILWQYIVKSWWHTMKTVCWWGV